MNLNALPERGLEDALNRAAEGQSDHYHALVWKRYVEENEKAAPTLDQLNTARDAEIRAMIELIEYRPGLMAEAMAQRNNILGYFSGVMNFSAASHPATYRLAWAAQRIGQFQSQWYKNLFNRPRPSHISPYLFPSIVPPGHPAYPSGHATEAYLIARALEQANPRMLDEGQPGRGPLRYMAHRIADNRVTIGVHYFTDNIASAKLARETFRIMLRCNSLGAMWPDHGRPAAEELDRRLEDDVLGEEGLIRLARKEWGV